MGDAAKLDEHIPAVADSVRRLVESDREPTRCYLHDVSRRMRLLREAASTRGLYPPSYGETFDVCMQMVREGLLTYAPPLDASRPWVGSRQLVLTAAGLAALEGGGR